MEEEEMEETIKKQNKKIRRLESCINEKDERIKKIENRWSGIKIITILLIGFLWTAWPFILLGNIIVGNISVEMLMEIIIFTGYSTLAVGGAALYILGIWFLFYRCMGRIE